MRIPLDYYRILCVPAKATPAQITQAYRDRLSQQPRREHSVLAIEARNRIIEQAFEILAKPESRAVYDHELSGNLFRSLVPSRPKLPFPDKVLGDLEEVVPHQQAIAIEKQDFLGGLLLLLDLGEYELVLKLAAPYLELKSKRVKDGELGEPTVVNQELRLCLALAHWELSREQWLQHRYEMAAASGRRGQTLLQENELFPGLQQEIQTELDRLRPYQILELLALPETEAQERQRGLALLQEMLDARGGVDGQGDDRSGLSTDDFLRFIQQLRSYLTVQEQLDLFVVEAKRPSAAAAYLAVYALLGAGFSRRQPQLVVQAQELLQRLGQRQDVFLEQSICALLLGQPTEANELLGQSQEQEAIAYIQEQSQGAPDLLPGLCVYGEQWLKTDVFSHFRDLRQRRDDMSVSLKAYFADPDVQQYLNDLLTEAPSDESPESEPEPEILATPATTPDSPEVGHTENLEEIAPESPTPEVPSPSHPEKLDSFEDVIPSHDSAVPTVPPETLSVPESEPVAISTSPPDSAPAAITPPPKTRLPWLAIALVTGGILALVGLMRLLSNPAPSPEPSQMIPDETAPSFAAPEPTETLPDNGTVTTPEVIFDEAITTKTIQSWLEAKAKAFGQNHDLAALETILAEPALAQWRSRAQTVKNAGNYRTYAHSLSVEKVTFNPEQPDVATVEAQVQEKAQYYRSNGALDASQSYDSDLRVQYGLVRQGDRWLIKSSQTL